MIKVSCFSNIGAYHPFSLRNAASLCQEFGKNLWGIRLTAKFSVSQRDRESGWRARGCVALVWLWASGAACLPFPKHEFHPCSIGSTRGCLFDPGQMRHSRANCSGLVPQTQTLFYSFACSKTLSQQSRLLATYEQVMGQRWKAILLWLEYIYIYITQILFVS